MRFACPIFFATPLEYKEPNMTQQSRTGGQILVAALQIHGVDTAFGVPGESYLDVLDALHDSGIRFIINRQEGGAAFMAEAYGKLTGKPGICFVTRGPGATNASIGVHTAYQDSTPMILFIGQVGNDFVDREAFQEIDYRRMYGQMAKWVAQIDRAERIPEYLARAFQVATSGRPGPVVLALPEDMLISMATVADTRAYQPVQASPSEQQLLQLRAMLAEAQRPLVRALPFGDGYVQHFIDVQYIDIKVDAVDSVRDAISQTSEVRGSYVFLNGNSLDFVNARLNAFLRTVLIPRPLHHTPPSFDIYQKYRSYRHVDNYARWAEIH